MKQTGLRIVMVGGCLFAVSILSFAQAQGNTATASSAGTQTHTAQPKQEKTQQEKAPASNAPSLKDLGFTPQQTAGNIQEQKRLDKRSHMLQIHQRLGLITIAPMVAAIIASAGAHGRHSSAGARDLHMGLGSATAGLYLATAYFAIFAPKVPETETRGPIRFHKALAWIHGPGMILTPILGAMAESQLNQGERVHGIAKYHGDVAVVTAIAYGLAVLSVSKPHWIPGLEHRFAAIFPFHHSAVLNASGCPMYACAGAETAPGGR